MWSTIKHIETKYKIFLREDYLTLHALTHPFTISKRFGGWGDESADQGRFLQKRPWISPSN